MPSSVSRWNGPATPASSAPPCAIAQTLWLPLADSGLQHEPHAVHVRISPPGTSLRCSRNHAFKATAHENKIRRWQTFTPPQSTAHAAHCGLVLHWRAPQKISTRDSPPVIGPFYAYFAVFRRPCRTCKYLIVLLIGVFITRRSAVRSCLPPPI